MRRARVFLAAEWHRDTGAAPFEPRWYSHAATHAVYRGVARAEHGLLVITDAEVNSGDGDWVPSPDVAVPLSRVVLIEYCDEAGASAREAGWW